MRTLLRTAGLIFLTFVTAAVAAPAQTVDWEDLVPKFEAELKNPLAEMELYRQLEVESIIWARALSEEERKSENGKAGLEDAAKFEKEFLKEGINLEDLLRRHKIWQTEVDRRGQQMVPELNGKKIKLAGYLLPLAFSEEGQTEFLLVPYVGACIHQPVPPPNQIVFVEATQSFKSEELFTPVWVTGTMKTKLSSKALTFVDGSADIPSGYTLSGGQVEIFTE